MVLHDTGKDQDMDDNSGNIRYLNICILASKQITDRRAVRRPQIYISSGYEGIRSYQKLLSALGM